MCFQQGLVSSAESPKTQSLRQGLSANVISGRYSPRVIQVTEKRKRQEGWEATQGDVLRSWPYVLMAHVHMNQKTTATKTVVASCSAGHLHSRAGCFQTDQVGKPRPYNSVWEEKEKGSYPPAPSGQG